MLKMLNLIKVDIRGNTKVLLIFNSWQGTDQKT